MLLLKITNKTRFAPNSVKLLYLEYLFQKTKILKFTKKKTFYSCLNNLVILNIINSCNIESKINSSYLNILSYFSNYQKPINYIINVNLSLTNTSINVSDIKGNPKVYYSAGMLDLKSKQKTKQPTAIIAIFKLILSKSNFLKKKAVALHCSNTLSTYESFITKRLKQKIFIKTIKSYKYRPHNGCRLRKKKRIKIRTKKFLKK
jgi:ribosomal protein S11